MRTLMRILAVIVLLGILLFILYMCTSQPDTPEPQPEPAVIDVTPEPEPEEEVATVATGEPTNLVPEEPEPVAFAPAECLYPGDSFTPYPHGFSPMDGGFIDFDYPVYLTGYDGETLPLLDAPAEDPTQSVCVMLTYDIDTGGAPVNIGVYDSAMAQEYDVAVPLADYETSAIDALKTRRYQPGRRNDKPVRIDNNVMEVRFVAQ